MSHQDLKTIIIHKKQDKKPQNNPSQVNQDGKKIYSGKNSQGPDFNAASVERKIDSGEIGAPSSIPKEVSQKIINARREKNIKTQKDLANMTAIPVTDINQMENGKFILTPQNKQKVRKVTNYLKISNVNL